MRRRSKDIITAEDIGTADPDAGFELRPSKTRLKSEAHALQTLGLALAELPPKRLAALNPPEVLADAIAQLRRTKTHEGRRRQLQYVGKQMRAVDPEPYRQAVAAFKLGSAQDTLRLHETEQWREELLAGDEAVTRWAAQYPDSDIQRLRTLVRNGRKDASLAPELRSGRGYRELFQFIKPWLVQDASLGALDGDDDADAGQDEDEDED